MSRAQARSVGELLVEADLLTRQVLADAPDWDERALLRTWPEVVQAAAGVWRALPGVWPAEPVSGVRAPHRHDLLMDRLEVLAVGLHRSMRGHDWPGPGAGDERLARVVDNFTRAATLLADRDEPVRPFPEALAADLVAARARVMHTLYVGAHGVGLAVGAHVRDLQASLRARHTIAGRGSLVHARAAQARLAAFEQLVGSYVTMRTDPSVLAGPLVQLPPVDRLGRALAGWDIQAHRTLTRAPTAAHLMVAAQTQVVVVSLGHALLRAGADTGALDAGWYAARLAPAVDAAQREWSALAAVWRQMTPPSARRIDATLGAAAGEARAALLVLVQEGAGLAAPAVVAGRVDLVRAAGSVQQALSAGADLAQLVRDQTLDPGLRGAARTVHAMAETLVAARGTPAQAPIEGWVRARAYAGNTPAVLPDILRAALVAAADRVVEASATAMSAATVLDHTRQLAPTWPAATMRATTVPTTIVPAAAARAAARTARDPARRSSLTP